MDAPNATALRASSDANALFSKSLFLPIQSVDSPASFPAECEAWACPIRADLDDHNTFTLPSYTSFLQDANDFFVAFPDNTNLPVLQIGQTLVPKPSSGNDCQQNWDFISIASDTAYSDTSSTSRDHRCNWPHCSNIDFRTAEEYKLHLKAHSRDVRTRWRPSESCNTCSWHGCKSQARLKTSKMLEDHISNIHINPLLCTRDGCKNSTPFRGKADLQRHIDSVHGNTPKIRCPFFTCQSIDEKTYSRKDKLINHLRRVHDTDPCPFSHCASSMFSSPDACESTARHIGKMHGEYECALQSCYGSKSQFSEEGFMAHLQLHHDLRWELVLKTKEIVKKGKGHVLKDEHLQGHSEISDCTSCPKPWLGKQFHIR